MASRRDRFGAINHRSPDPFKVCQDLFAVPRRRPTEPWHNDIKVFCRFSFISDAVTGATDMEIETEGIQNFCGMSYGEGSFAKSTRRVVLRSP